MREARAAFAQALACAVHALAAGIFGNLQHGGRFRVAVIEHLDQQERGAFFRAQALQQGEEGQAEAFDALQLRLGLLRFLHQRLG